MGVIIAAIITAAISLVIGLLNLYLVLKKLKRDKTMLKKQQKFEKEIEILKTKNQKNIFEFQQQFLNKEELAKNKTNRSKLILKVLQELKDVMYIFNNNLEKSGNTVYEEDAKQLKKTVFDYIKSYDENYMSMDSFEKKMIHELKHFLHSVIMEVEATQRIGLNDDDNSEIIKMINKGLQNISQVQEHLQDYYGNL